MFHQQSQNVIYTLKIVMWRDAKELNELSCLDICLCASPPVVNMCLDYDECGMGIVCENGVCVNTAGSFNCFCSPPLVLDSTRRRCVSLNTTEGTTETKRINCTLVDVIRLHRPNFQC